MAHLGGDQGQNDPPGEQEAYRNGRFRAGFPYSDSGVHYTI